MTHLMILTFNSCIKYVALAVSQAAADGYWLCFSVSCCQYYWRTRVVRIVLLLEWPSEGRQTSNAQAFPKWWRMSSGPDPLFGYSPKHSFGTVVSLILTIIFHRNVQMYNLSTIWTRWTTDPQGAASIYLGRIWKNFVNIVVKFLPLSRASQWRIYNHRMWVQLSTTCGNLLK